MLRSWRVKLSSLLVATVASRRPPLKVQELVIHGLVIGYLYGIALSASGIAVCETRKPGECSDAWNRGYTTATGLVTTFLAYLIPPSERPPSNLTRKKEEDASTEGS